MYNHVNKNTKVSGEMHSGKKRHFCGHCEEYLLTPAFKKHKDLYYDAATKTWTRKEDILASKAQPGAKDAYDEQIIAGNSFMQYSLFIDYQKCGGYL